MAAFAPTPKRCRLPGKRCRFEESTGLLIVEIGLRFVTLVLSLAGIIMNTIYHRILNSIIVVVNGLQSSVNQREDGVIEIRERDRSDA